MATYITLEAHFPEEFFGGWYLKFCRRHTLDLTSVLSAEKMVRISGFEHPGKPYYERFVKRQPKFSGLLHPLIIPGGASPLQSVREVWRVVGTIVPWERFSGVLGRLHRQES